MTQPPFHPFLDFPLLWNQESLNTRYHKDSLKLDILMCQGQGSIYPGMLLWDWEARIHVEAMLTVSSIFCRQCGSTAVFCDSSLGNNQ